MWNGSLNAYTLPRTGDRPLAFEGALLADASTRAHQGSAENRWWELALYRTVTGQLVAAIGYRTQWRGEYPSDTVYVATGGAAPPEAEIVAALQSHSYLAGMTGYPPGHEDRQRRLELALTSAWESGLSEILAKLEPEAI